MFIYYQTFIWI